MSKKPNIIMISKTTTSCSGDIESKHPKIYLKLQNNRAICPYCTRVFSYQTVNPMLKTTKLK